MHYDYSDDSQSTDFYDTYALAEFIPPVRGGNAEKTGMSFLQEYAKYVNLDKLTPLQMGIMQRILELDIEKQRGYYCVMPTGFGKTYLIAILIRLYLAANHSIVCMVTTRVHTHLTSVLDEMGTNLSTIKEQDICILHHNASNWLRKIQTWSVGQRKRICFLIDEAHLLSNKAFSADNFLSFVGRNIGRGHLYLFSATPVVHHLAEFSVINLLLTTEHKLKLAANPIPDRPADFDRQFAVAGNINVRQLREVLQPYVLYADSPLVTPRLLEPQIVYCTMALDVFAAYRLAYSITGQTNNTARMQDANVAMECGTHKLAALTELIVAADGPVIVYSRYIIQFEEALHKSGLATNMKLAVLSSGKTATEWAEIMATFNSADNRDGQKIKVLAFGPSGKVGINFVTPRTIIFMSPLVSYADIIQVAGRALRANSLEWMAAADRTVACYILTSQFDPHLLAQFTVADAIKPETIMTKEYKDIVTMEESRKLYEIAQVILQSLNVATSEIVGGGHENLDTEILDILTWIPT